MRVFVGVGERSEWVRVKSGKLERLTQYENYFSSSLGIVPIPSGWNICDHFFWNNLEL